MSTSLAIPTHPMQQKQTKQLVRPLCPGFQQIFYGGDYNPEQWPEEVWAEDISLMREAGVNFVSLGIFSWAKLNPAPGVFEFGWLDRIMDMLHEGGIWVDLATATASPPAWLAEAFPDVRPCDASGLLYYHGSRQAYSPNSPSYRKFATELVEALALRYGKHPALALWHINNEYACHLVESYTDADEAAWREWLQNKYGSIENLNSAWGTAFWSQIYYAWEEVRLPRKTPYDVNPAQRLDAYRFFSDSFCSLIAMERAILERITPAIPVTTNFIGLKKELDQFQAGALLDLPSWDSYPDPDPELQLPGDALGHDLTRASGRGGPFLLMEQAFGQVNWRPVNHLKRPGMMRLWSWQAVARGADGVLFFQWRKSRAGAEKFHGAMLEHGDPRKSRSFAEVSALGKELRSLGVVRESRIVADCAVIFDWDNWWALEIPGKPRTLDYAALVRLWHQSLIRAHFAVDIVHPGEDFSKYQALFVPHLYLLKKEHAESLERFVHSGGTLVVGAFSGIVEAHDEVVLGGYPAYLRSLLGLWVEEWEPYPDGRQGVLRMSDGRTFSCSLWHDLLHLEGAEVMATFATDFFAGRPALTQHPFGKGIAYYLATIPEAAFFDAFLSTLDQSGKIRPLAKADQAVEITLRQHPSSQERFWFFLNHSDEPTEVDWSGHAGKDLVRGTPVSGAFTLGARDAIAVQEE